METKMPRALYDRFVTVATLKNKPVAEWVRETLEKAAEGEIVFMQRRSGS